MNWNPFDLGWRTVFFFNVPFGLLVLLLMPIVPETRAEQAHSIDWTGSFLLLIGLFLLIYPLSEGQKQGWPLWIFGCLMLALFVLFTFIWVENRKGKQGALPLVDLSIFRDRTFSAGLATVLVLYLSMFSFFFILSYYMQFGLHYSVQDTSMVFLPIGIGFFLTSLISSRMVKRWGMSVLKIGALMMGSCSLLLMLELNVDVTQLLDPRNILLLLIYGFGLGMATTPLVNVTLSSVPTKITGTGSGLITTFMYFANSLGVALIGILFSASLKHSLLEADLADYVRAFSFSLAAIGGLAFTGFLCLCFLRERKL
ncbi:Multidrug resistance protein stp [compost metagenome]